MLRVVVKVDESYLLLLVNAFFDPYLVEWTYGGLLRVIAAALIIRFILVIFYAVNTALLLGEVVLSLNNLAEGCELIALKLCVLILFDRFENSFGQELVRSTNLLVLLLLHDTLIDDFLCLHIAEKYFLLLVVTIFQNEQTFMKVAQNF